MAHEFLLQILVLQNALTIIVYDGKIVSGLTLIAQKILSPPKKIFILIFIINVDFRRTLSFITVYSLHMI